MNEIQKKFIESPGRYLMHYNHNHDRLGRFARSNGVASNSKYTRSDKKAAIRQYEYDHPKNKGMSPIDHIYDYILKRDAIKRDKDWKKTPPEHLDISEYKKTDNFVQDFKNIDFGPNASSENIKAYQTLQGAIIDKSVDWYNSIPKTERTKKHMLI